MSCNCFGRYTLWGVALLAPIAPLMGQTDTTLEAHVLPSLFDDSRDTRALDINDRGQIVGWSTNSADRPQATFWNQQSEPRRLACPERTTECRAVAINNRGTTVGEAVPNDFYPEHGSLEFRFIVKWSAKGEVSRATTPSGLIASHASDINDHGFVVGSGEAYELGPGPRTATFWRRNGAPTQKLQPLASDVIIISSEALAVNSNRSSLRQVVGYTQESFFRALATVWDRSGRATALQPLPTDSDFSSKAKSVNRRGTVVGESFIPTIHGDVSTAVVWGTSEYPTALESLSGCEQGSAEDINDAGFVVGSNSACAGRPGDVAVIWNPEGEVFALPLPAKFVASNAVAINSQGDVVGYAVNRNGKTVAIVWR